MSRLCWCLWWVWCGVVIVLGGYVAAWGTVTVLRLLPDIWAWWR